MGSIIPTNLVTSGCIGVTAAATTRARLVCNVTGTRMMTRDTSPRTQLSSRLGARRVDAALLNALTDAVLLVDAAGVIVQANAAAARLFDYPGDDLVGQPVEVLVPASLRPRHGRLRALYATAPSPRPMGASLPLTARRRDGAEIAVDITLSPVDAGGAPMVIAVVRDLTARLEAERRRAELMARVARATWEWGAAADALPMLVCLADLAGRIVRVNHTLTRWGLGLEDEVQGRGLADVMAPLGASVSGALRELVAEPERGAERVVETDDGSARRLKISVAPAPPTDAECPCLAVLVEDVTVWHRAQQDRLRLENELANARRLDALGKLAGGFAHDLNNMLVALTVSADLLEQELPAAGVQQELLADMRMASERAGALARRLLAFGRRQFMQPVRLDLNQVVLEQTRLLRRLLPEHLRLELVATASPLCVLVDRSQVEQVLLNMVVNARDAMSRGGVVRVETGVVEDRDVPAHALPSEVAGPRRKAWALILVADEGVGISAEVQRRLFEPFFSTKPDGHGLGLSTVYGIVQQSGGRIHVCSEEGVGSTFRVFLPLSEGGSQRPPPPEPPRPSGEVSGTVLIVEDEVLPLRALTRALTRAGYRVLAACSPQDARALVEAHDGRIDVLVTDVVMPDESGPQFARALLQRHPHVKVLYMSGHTDDQALREEFGQHSGFLPKPFDTPTLLRTLQGLVAPPTDGAREGV